MADKKKLLFVNSCIRGEKSRTLKLAKLYIDKFLSSKAQAGESWALQEVDLNREKIQVQDAALLEKREDLIAEKAFEDPVFDYARQFIEADFILIAAPYWDWQFPALLKIYLERCSVSGLTYIFDEKGCSAGRCKSSKVVYITTAGGYMEGLNMGYDYLVELMKIFGIETTELIAAEGLDLAWNDCGEIMAAAMRDVESRF